MSRQLFIHHYLPSHLASALVAGAVLHFLLSETIQYPISIRGHSTRPRKPQWAELGARGPAIVVAYFLALFAAFFFIAPLTYGTPGYVPFRLINCKMLTYCLIDWMAMQSIPNDCYNPGRYTLLAKRRIRRDGGRRKSASDVKGVRVLEVSCQQATCSGHFSAIFFLLSALFVIISLVVNMHLDARTRQVKE
jgi:hypothetical protein